MAQNPPPLTVVITAEDKTRAAIEQAQRGFGGLQASAASLRGVLVGATAALGGLAAVVQFKAYVDTAAALDDMAEKTGASVERLSALSNVARISGTDLGTVEGALTRLAKGLAGADEESKGAGNALKALGLNAQELAKLDTAESLKIVADRLNEYKDGAGKTALAIDLLGKSGAQALPFLKDLAETQDLSARITAEQAAQAENLQKNLNRLAISTTEAWREFSAAVLPVVDAFVKALLDAQTQSGGLRDKIRELGADGSIRGWAETAAIGLAYLVDAFKNLVNVADVTYRSLTVVASGLELAYAKIRRNLEGNRNSTFWEREIANIRRAKEEAENATGGAVEKFLNAPQFSEAVKRQFAALRDIAAGIDAGADLGGRPGKKALNYRSNIEEAGKAAKDELKAIDSYVSQIREQLVGATEGEFQKMRQKALDVFGAVDFSTLSSGDRARFAEAFAEVTEAIETLEEKAINAQWGKALADQFKIAGEAADRADEAFSQFVVAQSRTVQDLEFEVSMVGKLAAERQKLAAIRRIELDAQRAQAQIPEGAANRDERIADIAAAAEQAKQKVGELNDTLRNAQRDGLSGLQGAARNYFDRITNDAENFGGAFTSIMGRLEDTFVKFASTGKFEFKNLVDAIIADLARIVVRQQITAPLAASINGALGGGGGGLGGLFAGLFGGGGGGGIGPDMYDIPFYATGTDYVPRDTLAVVHQGERIIPAAQNNADWGAVNIVQHINIDSRSDQASIRAAMEAAKEQAKAEIMDSRLRGGAFA